jgi:hypothetical protein
VLAAVPEVALVVALAVAQGAEPEAGVALGLESVSAPA